MADSLLVSQLVNVFIRHIEQLSDGIRANSQNVLWKTKKDLSVKVLRTLQVLIRYVYDR